MNTQEIQDAIQKRLEKEAGLFDYSGEMKIDISTAGGKPKVALEKKSYYRCLFVDIKSDLNKTDDVLAITIQTTGKDKSRICKDAAKYIMNAIKERNKL